MSNKSTHHAVIAMMIWVTHGVIDAYTTYIVISFGGKSMEINPIGRWSMDIIGLDWTILIMFIFVSILSYMIYKILNASYEDIDGDDNRYYMIINRITYVVLLLGIILVISNTYAFVDLANQDVLFL